MSTTTHASADASTVPATKPAPTTTISLPPYNFDNSVPPPKLIQTGTDYKAILQSLLDYGNWLSSSRPDISLVDKVAAPGSKIAESMRHDLGLIAKFDRRLYETNNGTARLDVLTVTPTAVSARYVQQLRRQVVVARGGDVIDQKVLSAPTTAYNVVMTKSTRGLWRLASVAPVPETK